MKILRNKIDYACEKCGHIKVKKWTFWRVTKGFFLAVLFIYMGSMTLLGTLAVYNLATLTDIKHLNFVFADGLDQDEMQSRISIGNAYATLINFKSNFLTSDDKIFLTEYALNHSSDCVGAQDEKLCRAEALYKFLSADFTYEEGWTINARKLIEEHSGDCDEMSYLYKTLLNILGIESKLQCNETHCWVIINQDGSLIKADITKQIWRLKNE